MKRQLIANGVCTALGKLCAAVALLIIGSGAHAAVVLQDTYYGGLDTYNNPNDIIGDPSVFDIASAVVERVGPGGDTLQVTINTNFAGRSGTPPADGTGYGTLFLSPGAWQPTGTAPNYPEDVFQPGDWKYVFTIPQSPGSGAQSGAGNLYLTSQGTVQLANVNGNPITYPFSGNPGYYFRQGQAVQFTAGPDASPVATGGWQVSAIGDDLITFQINDNHLLGDYFALSWAITCANDIIQGQISGVPEPQTWIMMIMGFGFIGFAMRRRRVIASTS